MGIKIIATILVTVGLLFGISVEAFAPEQIDETTYSYSENWIENVTLVEGVS